MSFACGTASSGRPMSISNCSRSKVCSRLITACVPFGVLQAFCADLARPRRMRALDTTMLARLARARRLLRSSDMRKRLMIRKPIAL